MQAVKPLPLNYRLFKHLDLSKPITILAMNLLAIPLLFLFGWLFNAIIVLFQHKPILSHGFLSFFISLHTWELIALPFTIIIVIISHELIHGGFFWLETHDLPKFALRSGYAFTAAPGWYIPRTQYIWVGLSPILIISIISIFLLLILPTILAPLIFLAAILNAAGSLGDVIVAIWVISQPADTLINDHGDSFSSYLPGSLVRNG